MIADGGGNAETDPKVGNVEMMNDDGNLFQTMIAAAAEEEKIVWMIETNVKYLWELVRKKKLLIKRKVRIVLVIEDEEMMSVIRKVRKMIAVKKIEKKIIVEKKTIAEKKMIAVKVTTAERMRVEEKMTIEEKIRIVTKMMTDRRKTNGEETIIKTGIKMKIVDERIIIVDAMTIEIDAVKMKIVIAEILSAIIMVIRMKIAATSVVIAMMKNGDETIVWNVEKITAIVEVNAAAVDAEN